MSNTEIILAVVIPFVIIVAFIWTIFILRWRRQYQRDLARLNLDYDNLLRELQTVRIEKINNALTALEIKHRSTAAYKPVLQELSNNRDKIRQEVLRVSDLIERKRVETRPTAQNWPVVFKNTANSTLRRIQDSIDNIEQWEREFYARVDDVTKGAHHTSTNRIMRLFRQRRTKRDSSF